MTAYLCLLSLVSVGAALAADPVPLIYDTDMGNDIDDALALAVIHALETRGECKLLGVTLTKDNKWAAPYVDLVNTFYRRGDIPIGVVRNGKTPKEGKYIRVVAQKKAPGGSPLYPHDLTDGGNAPEAVGMLRKLLASQQDGAVVIAQVGFSTNLARLLDSSPDDASALGGRELVAKKVRLLSVMGGAFPSTATLRTSVRWRTLPAPPGSKSCSSRDPSEGLRRRWRRPRTGAPRCRRTIALSASSPDRKAF